MLHLIAGGEDKWRARPFVSQSNCFVVPPMKFAHESCLCMEVAVRGGMPILLVSARPAPPRRLRLLPPRCSRSPMPGRPGLRERDQAQVAGHLRHLVLRVGPAHRRDVGRQPRAGTSVRRGHADVEVLRPDGRETPSGMSDSKMPDAQAGAEKALLHALIGNSGANMIYESAGMLASLLGFSMESLLIDNDIIGAAQRTIRGIEVDDESISLDTMRSVCLDGPGHYLGATQTLKLMQKDYLYPDVSDRSSPNQWVEQGRPTQIDRASKKLATILASHYPTHIPAAIDEAIRQRFPVRLAPAAMLRAAS